MRRRLYEGYEGYYTDDQEEDEAKIRDTFRCFRELNEIFNGYIIQIDGNEIWFSGENSPVDVHMKLERSGRINSASLSLDSDFLGNVSGGALLGDLLNGIYNAVKKNGSKIDKILKYMDDNGLDFDVVFNLRYRKQFG